MAVRIVFAEPGPEASAALRRYSARAYELAAEWIRWEDAGLVRPSTVAGDDKGPVKAVPVGNYSSTRSA